MGKYNSSYIRSLSKNDMLKELELLNNELIRERAKKSTGTVPENPKLIYTIKKKVARINTIINEKCHEKEN